MPAVRPRLPAGDPASAAAATAAQHADDCRLQGITLPAARRAVQHTLSPLMRGTALLTLHWRLAIFLINEHISLDGNVANKGFALTRYGKIFGKLANVK